MNIGEINNNQILSICDKYIEFKQSRNLLSIDISKELNIPVNVLNDLDNHIVKDSLLVEYLVIMGKYFDIKLSDWFKL